MASYPTTRIAYYDFQLNNAIGEHLGGTGICLTTLVKFLKAQQDRVMIRFIPCEPSHLTYRNRWQKLKAFLAKQLLDIRDLLTPNEDVLLFYYPKIPLLGRSNDPKVLFFAALGYGLLAIKKKVTGQRVAVLILDLPVEMGMIESTQSASDMVRFYDLKNLPWPKRLVSYVERLIFKMADTIISPSKTETDHIVQKHALPATKIILERRHSYMPTYDKSPRALQLEGDEGLRIFYSGNLGLPIAVDNLKKMIQVFKKFPASHFYLCGKNGEWINGEMEASKQKNIHYLGVLDYTTHDAVARQCDVGLLLYDHCYYDLAAPAKYSAYVANGLAVLSTDRVTLSNFVQEDQVGLALPLAELPAQLEQWLRFPQQVTPYQVQAQKLSQNFTQGTYMQEWFDKII